MLFNVTKIRLFTCLIALNATAVLIILFIMHHHAEDVIHHGKASDYHLADIMDDARIKNTNIFFHETSYILSKTNVSIDMPPREACSVESAARQNPNSTIFLLVAKPFDSNRCQITLNTSSPIVRELLKYPNVVIRTLDVKRYTLDTPLKDFIASKKLQKSKFPKAHASDVLRFATLWKYGGIYMDLDIVIMKDLSSLGLNFAATESKMYVASSILAFDHGGIGHDVADGCVKEIRDHFDGKHWGNNGPGVITKVLKKYCNTQNLTTMISRPCNGFRVLPTPTFYPVYFSDWNFYFKPDKLNSILEAIKSSYGVHVWNKLSSESAIYKNNSEVAYSYIAKKYCPNVFGMSGDTF